jgi:hypothetical protein
MMTNNQLRVLIGLVVLIWAGALVAQGQHVPLDYFKAFSYAITGASFGLIFWERWLWSWRVFRPWLTTRPDLRGTWKGHLVSDWIDPNTKQGLGEIEGYLVIRQTYSTADIRLLTSESGSVTLSANIFSDNAGVHTVAAVYRNTPRILIRGRSPISHGGMLLCVRGTPVHQLDGEYWTDRATKGEIILTHRAKTLYHDFDQAHDGHYKKAA